MAKALNGNRLSLADKLSGQINHAWRTSSIHGTKMLIFFRRRKGGTTFNVDVPATFDNVKGEVVRQYQRGAVPA